MFRRTPRPHFIPGKDPLPILQEAGWAPGSVWKGGKSRPHRDSILDRPAHSSVAIPTELPGPQVRVLPFTIIKTQAGMKLGRREKKPELGSNIEMERGLLAFLQQLYHAEH